MTDIFNEMHGVPTAAVFPIRRNCSETYDDGTALYYEGDISDSDCGSVEDRERILGRTGANLHFKMDTVFFHRIWTIRCRR